MEIKSQTWLRRGGWLVWFGFVIYLGLFLILPEFGNRVSYAEENTSEEEVSLTLAVAETGALAKTMMPGTRGTVAQTYSVTTTNNTGYKLTLETIGESTDLVSLDGTGTIPTITLSSNAESKVFTSLSGEYGFSLDGTNFLPVPAVGETFELKKTKTATTTADETEVTFGISVPTAAPAGTYQNQFRVTAIANPEYDPETYFEQIEPAVFDGTNYIDTEIKLFSAENWEKDFIFTATVDAMPTSYTNFDTLFSCMDESGEPYPGLVLRMNSKTATQIVANVNTKTNGKSWTLKEGMEIVIKRVNKKLYYSYDGGDTFIFYADYDDFTGQFDNTATIGASKKGDGTPWRYFTGTMSNIKLELLDPTSYTIEYDLNGGTGTFEPQLMAPGMTEALRAEKPTKTGKMFDCWNTAADGSGTCYEAGATVTDLAQVGETITLYAQWKEPIQYIVRFHDGLASDETVDQTLTYSYSTNLAANTFVNGTSLFGVWNTAADGSGKYYVDGQEVLNLSETENDVIDLYAVWGSEVFSLIGATVFDGTNYLDSGIKLFSETNAQKDFIAVFTITAKTYTNMGTIMNAMDETGSPWPGLVYRMNSSTRDDLIGNANNSTKKTIYNTTALGEQIVITRKNNTIYLKVGDEAVQTGANFTNLLRTFDVNTTFGAGDNGSGTMQRYFKGTIENIALVVLEADE